MRTLDGAEASTSFRRRERERLAKKNSGSNSILRGFSQLLSLDTDSWGGSGGEAPLGEDEKEAEARAFDAWTRAASTRSLPTRSFWRRIRCSTWSARWSTAAGGKPEGPGGAEGVPRCRGIHRRREDVDGDAAAFCLDVLVGVTLRNRDRVRRACRSCTGCSGSWCRRPRPRARAGGARHLRGSPALPQAAAAQGGPRG